MRYILILLAGIMLVCLGACSDDSEPTSDAAMDAVGEVAPVLEVGPDVVLDGPEPMEDALADQGSPPPDAEAPADVGGAAEGGSSD